MLISIYTMSLIDHINHFMIISIPCEELTQAHTCQLCSYSTKCDKFEAILSNAAYMEVKFK